MNGSFIGGSGVTGEGQRKLLNHHTYVRTVIYIYIHTYIQNVSPARQAHLIFVYQSIKKMSYTYSCVATRSWMGVYSYSACFYGINY